MKPLYILLFSLLITTTINAQKVTFGVISDVHQDLQKDAALRLKTFINDAQSNNSDFIIQLGDLCHSKGADSILKVWNSTTLQKYNVFGNHDMDNASKAEMIAKYEMPGSYYYFDKNNVRFIVLDCAFTIKDGKETDYNNGNYFVSKDKRDLISTQQIKWVEETVNSSSMPCVIFSHPAFDEVGGSVPNREELRNVVEKINNNKKKVIAFICGHHHIDAHTNINGIDYLQINSCSYMWIEGKKQYSNGNMAEYKDPVYAFITINTRKRTITIKGKQSEFIAPAPSSNDFTPSFWQYVNAGIRDRIIKY